MYSIGPQVHLTECLIISGAISKMPLLLSRIFKNLHIVFARADLSSGRISNMKICGLMMVKNEEKLLPYVLKSLEGFCDDVVALVHQSTDNTYDILKSHPLVKTVLKYDGPWNEPIMRSKLIEEGKKLDPDWFIVVDGDELYEVEARSKFENLVAKNPKQSYKFELY